MEQEFDELPKSKSQIKRELQELQVLGKQLVELPDKKLLDIPVSDKLREAILAAKSMKHGALSRQFKFIGNLMPNEDEASIRKALDKSRQPHKDDVNAFHALEEWRDRLLQNDQPLLDELALKFDEFERQYVGQLIRNAKKEQKLDKPPKSARLLFKYLSELQQSSKTV
ncbi:MAG: ribosome-associated protein [Gammaproteobacteria bacterium]|jgi:ribosome-associated protein